MKIAVVVCRVILGLGFVVFGLNIIHPFLPQPPFPSGSLSEHFFIAVGTSGWMTVVGVLQLLGGAFVLSGRLAPIGLTLLGPILVNILLFHICLMAGAGIVPGLVFAVLEIFLIYAYRNYFLQIFSSNARPAA